MSPGARIDYKVLRQINPEAARKAVLEYLKTNGGNKAEAARVFGINRTVVYDILRKAGAGDLQDRPKTPKHQPNKAPPEVERTVIAARNKTHLGPKRLTIYLAKYQEQQVPPGTTRFVGFFQPVENPPVFNVVKGGSSVPVKFSLGGFQGLDIFLSGYPISRQIACDSSAPLDNIEQSVTPGSSGLSYDSTTDQYTDVWKTKKAWAGTCRQLVVILKDGSIHYANFKFK